MLKIRLKRLGRKKRAYYRIILINNRKKRDGKALEEIGFYDPFSKQQRIDTIKVKKMVNNGAQLTSTVKNLLKKNYS
uniref:Small ribosomal subunit protein bS16c n=1 Tax=Kuetzingia canaliculata TaxID=228262 RepID=A0A1Z1MQB2_KUECA|nr:ribosomal protein S16 [Kuetzingia canaliculata]ARW67975.1 ribosomal protein S16 [Kuetzingia canaliculata]